MARIETIVRVCDMPHYRDDVEAQAFELYSRAAGHYEVDLCESCAKKVLTVFMANGRKYSGRGQVGRPVKRVGRRR